MPFSMSQASLPSFEISLNALSAILLGPTTGHMNGADYLIHFLLPNFHFHVTAAYAILRHCGVDIAKSDYFGAIPIKTT